MIPRVLSRPVVLSVLAASSLSLSGVHALADGGDLRPLKAKTGLAPFGYTNAADPLPNYVAGARWGTQTDPIRTMQTPLSPEESAKHIVVQPGFESKLWAADPDITKPIALAWDDRGRLWIAETVDYPNEQQPEGQGRDRIKICEDTDGDGKADKFTIFADKLTIPTSLCFANGGVIVIEGGHTLFLQDTNGDDKADVRKVLFSGWGMGDTHATASNLRYGIDNWIYGTVGYSGFDGVVGGKQHKFGMGVYRFKPDGSAMEFLRSSNNNTWGLGLTEDGTVLGSTANRNASWYMPIPNRFYEAVQGWSAARMETIADSQAIYPITEKVRQVDQHGMYTAGAGHALYTARSFPKEYWNRIAFVTEPTGHLVGWFRIEASGADYKAVNQGSFLASDDEWTAPIVAEVGPDGAVWVIDWYNYIVQHNPVPAGFKNGRGNAYETKLRDKRHGRIYRVQPTAAAKSAVVRLDNADTAGLVNALKSDNQLWRLHAQRLLVQRGGAEAVPALRALVLDRSTDELGLNPGAVHALWTLHGLHAVGDSAVAALRHPSAAVRRAAIGVLPRDSDAASALLDSGVARDPDAQARLATYLAFAELEENEAVGSAIAAALREPSNASDRWLREALTAAATHHLASFGQALLSEPASVPPPAFEAARIVSRHYASAAPDSIAQVVAGLAPAPAGLSSAVLEGLAAGWPEGRRFGLDADAKDQVNTALGNFAPAARARFLVLAQKWGVLSEFRTQLVEAVANLRTQLTNASLEDGARLSAARSLVRLADEPASVKTILEQITPQVAPPMAFGCIDSLSESRNPATAGELIGVWVKLTPNQKRAALALLVRRGDWAGTLLEAVANGTILRNDLGPEHWQQLRSSGNAQVATRARELATGGGPISADRQEVVKKFLPAAKLAANAEHGREVFTKNCAVCHRFNGAGASIGPELTGIGARPKEDILMEILDPNRSVEANYRLWNLTTKSGDTFSGRLDAETQTSVELLDLGGQKHVVQRRDIASLESSNQSIMPVGLESIGEADLAAVLAYLATSVEGPAKK